MYAQFDELVCGTFSKDDFYLENTILLPGYGLRFRNEDLNVVSYLY